METSNKTYRYGRLEHRRLANVISDYFGPFLRDDPDGARGLGLPFSLIEDIMIVSTDLDAVPFRYPEEILKKQIENLSVQVLLHWKRDLDPIVSADDIASILLDNAVRWECFDNNVSIFITEEVSENA